jgi:flavin reductase (DIM6/NTAB) family NADH-FMN oxidoreductase RutF
MSITSEEFRDCLRHFPSGVTIVTVHSQGMDHGLTVSAFASVSPEPPLIMVIIDQQHSAYPLLEQEGATFAVSILREDQTELSERFAWVKDEDRFLLGDWRPAATGALVLEDCLAWLDCTLFARYPAGTHTIYVGEVVASHVAHPGQPPLTYWNRHYRRLNLAD